MRIHFFWGILIGLAFFASCSSDSNTKRHNLTTTATPAEGGTVTPSSGEYEDGEEIEISATSNEHWLFDGWQGDLSGDTNPQTITMDSDKNVAALFVKRDYPLTITIQGQGTVAEQIVQQKATDYPHGTVVELTAEPAEGSEFVGWQGDIETTENPTTITIEEETEITAVFSGVEYPLEVTVEGEGTVYQEVVQSKTDYPEGTVVELTAEAAEDWIFSEWSGDLEGEENPSQLTVDSPKEVTATFLRTYNLITIANPEEGGSISPEAGQYVRDTTLEVEAVPSEGWQFVEWEGDFSGSVNPFDLTMNGNKTITANFGRKLFDFEIDIEGQGDVDVSVISGTQKGDKYEYETVLELLAEPDEGWSFDRWSLDIESEENPVEIEINSDTEIRAHFVETAFLADNGVTIMCPNASVGDIGIVDGVEYEVVDRNLFFARKGQDADLTRVCTSLIKDMSGLFAKADLESDQGEFNQDISSWDVSNVTDMSGMFFGSTFNQPIGDWDVSNVKDMSGMFGGVDWYSSTSKFNQDISSWDVSNVEDMSTMFKESEFNQDIGDWDVSNVKDMSGMFMGAKFNQPIGEWNVSNVTDMSGMFGGVHYYGAFSDFNQSIGNWDVSNVEDMSEMFYGSVFNQPIGNWDVSSVTNMNSMFAGYSDRNFYELYKTAFNQSIGNWDVSNVEDMSEMFYGSVFNQPIGNWDVSSVTSMVGMFQASSFDQSISDWDVGSVTNVSGMFSGLELVDEVIETIFNQPIGDWDVSSVKDMNDLFHYNSEFNQPIGDWDVSAVNSMERMFMEAKSFNQPINIWCVSNIESEPEDFSTGSPLTEENKPVWGTCPN